LWFFYKNALYKFTVIIVITVIISCSCSVTKFGAQHKFGTLKHRDVSYLKERNKFIYETLKNTIAQSIDMVVYNITKLQANSKLQTVSPSE